MCHPFLDDPFSCRWMAKENQKCRTRRDNRSLDLGSDNSRLSFSLLVPISTVSSPETVLVVHCE